MKYYVNLSTINNTINYFRNIDYSKPEQIGLFLYFKKAGLHSFGYEKYKKWGDFDSPEREGYLRNLYDLAGIFDETCENPLKYTALFPFSITNYYKSLSYYNGGSPFKTLGSRISDTLDNSLVSTIIQRDVNDKNNLMFNADYLNYIKNKQLKGHLIPLTAIASWCYRFYAVEMPDGFLEKDFTDVLILAFLMEYNISYNEFIELFSFDSRPIDHSDSMVTATQLRDLLGVKNGDCTPEIQDGGVVDFMPVMRTISLNTVNKLLDQRGTELTKERIEAILRDRDEKIKKKCELASRTEIERAILECWEKKDFNYEPNIEQLYTEFNKLFGKEALKSFSDRECLYNLFGLKEDNSLVYYLEHSNQYGYFGGVGGYRTIYTLYQKDGEWKYCTNAKNVKTIDETKAEEIAVDYRNKFVAIFDEIERLIDSKLLETLDGFSTLQSAIKEKLGDILYNRNWAWKYLHMIFPNLFMNVFSLKWVNKVFRVAALIPANNYTLQCGQFSLFAKSLGISNVYLYHILRKLDDAEDDDEDAELANEKTSIDFAWYVGATGTNDNGEHTDFSEQYISEGRWENRYDHKYIEVVKTMKEGDRIVIKSSYTKKNGLPFENKGQVVGVMGIKAIGVITKNHMDGKNIDVEWKKVEPIKEWYGDGVLRTTVHCVRASDGYIKQALLKFTFDNMPQDYSIFEQGIDEVEESRDMTTKEIKQFNSRVRTTHTLNSILYGAPGTGKTYSTAEYAVAIIENRGVDLSQKNPEERKSLMNKYKSFISDGRIVFTTFHQSYGYEDFIQGLRPDAKAGTISFVPVDGVFKRIADNAMQHPELDYVIIIDEINRANISKVFGELITLIEEDKRWGETNALSVTLPSGEEFAVPNNLYIMGTMNSADKSISLIDTALRRRFDFIEVVPNEQLVSDLTLRTVLTRLNDGLVKELDSTDLLIGHAYFIGKTADDLCNIMNNNIIPLLYEYFYDNSKKVEKQVKDAVDGFDVEIKKATVGRIKLVKKG